VKNSIPKTIWILGFVSLLNDVSTEMIHSVLPMFLVATLGASVTIVGLIEGTAEAIGSILKVFSGALSDYIGHRKWLVFGGYALSTLLKPLYAIASSPLWVLTARLGDRIGKGIRVAPRDALMADCTDPENRGAAYGLRQSLDTVGAVIGPLAASALLFTSSQNFRLIFWTALAPAGLAVILLATGIREPKASQAKSPANPINMAALRGLGKQYWALVLVAFVFNLGNSSDAFLLLKAQTVGISAPHIPLVLVTMNVSYAISSYPCGVLSDKLGRFDLLLSSFVLYVAVYAGFALADQPWQIWSLLVLYGFYLGLSQGNLLAFVADTIPSQLRGTAFGAINLVVGFALLPASMLAGLLWQYVSPAATFFAGSALAVLAIIVFLLLVNPDHKRPGAHQT
jgi:MFS family permease